MEEMEQQPQGMSLEQRVIVINQRIDQLKCLVEQFRNDNDMIKQRDFVLPVLVELKTVLLASDKPRWHADAKILESGIQNITRRSIPYGGYVPDHVKVTDPSRR